MTKYNIELKVFLSDGCYYYSSENDPNIPDQKIQYMGLHEPFRRASFAMRSSERKRLSDLCSVDLYVSNDIDEEYTLNLSYRHLSDLSRLEEVCKSINSFFDLGPYITKIEFQLYTSETDSFIQSFFTQLFTDYSGNIPLDTLESSPQGMKFLPVKDYIFERLKNELETHGLKVESPISNGFVITRDN